MVSKIELEKEHPEHEVLRYIQSSDFGDAQRLLGLYNLTHETELDCDQDLVEEFKKNIDS